MQLGVQADPLVVPIHADDTPLVGAVGAVLHGLAVVLIECLKDPQLPLQALLPLQTPRLHV